MSSHSICRFGILGAASIARKNWQGLRFAENCSLVAVASRSLERAQAFIDECQMSRPYASPPEAMESYDALLARKDIDAVYIPLPTGLRKDWVLKAAKAGKHILCEKPVGVDAAAVEEMLAACRTANVQFMDGVMFMHSARLSKMREVLDDGKTIGEIRRIASEFSFRADAEFVASNIRADNHLEPLGCLGDLGWYNLRIILWALGYQLPEYVTAKTLHATPGGVPLEFSAELFFRNHVSATFYCSFITEHQQWTKVSGTLGSLSLEDFVLPYYGSESAFLTNQPDMNFRVCDTRFQNRTRRVAVPEFSNSDATAQETNMFRTFGKLALGGKPDENWGRITLATQKVTNACMEAARTGKPVELKA